MQMKPELNQLKVQLRLKDELHLDNIINNYIDPFIIYINHKAGQRSSGSIRIVEMNSTLGQTEAGASAGKAQALFPHINI